MSIEFVREHDVKVIVFEADWSAMWRCNEYVHKKAALPFSEEKGRFPVWMWRNESFFNFLKKLRKMQNPPYLFGMDCYDMMESKRRLLRFLKRVDPTYETEVRARLSFLDRFKSGREYGMAAVNGNLSRVADHIQNLLQKIQAKLQWEKTWSCTALERLDAEQCCEIIISSEEYYRKLLSEPPGSQSTWNARDQHMCTTLLRIRNHLENSKIVVWAHNSHIGDCTATARGGVSFERNETWNLGQMVRATFPGKTHIVGFYTYQGQVMAAERWGGPHRARDLMPAFPESYEHRLHELKIPRLYFHTNVEEEEEEEDVSNHHPYHHKNFKSPYVTPPPKLPCMYKRIYDDVVVTSTREVDFKTTNIERTLKNKKFVAVERWTCPSRGTVRLKMSDGRWITEYSPHGSITLQCCPCISSRLEITTPRDLLSETRLQRWVGVQYVLSLGLCVEKYFRSTPTLTPAPTHRYHPKTELRSHYGEVTMKNCYDTVVFVDQTTALREISEYIGVPTNAASAKRLMKEYNRMLRRPVKNVEAHPLEQNLLEWHFLIKCSQFPYVMFEFVLFLSLSLSHSQPHTHTQTQI